MIDNYSRYFLAWQILSSSYDDAKTAELLERALKRSTGRKLSLIVDGGSEALFRQAKNNYLYSQKIDSIKSLLKHAKFWFKEHNEVIPHTAFNGETPIEKFKQNWDKNEEIRILVRHEEAIKLRIQHNQNLFCKLCDVACVRVGGCFMRACLVRAGVTEKVRFSKIGFRSA